MSTVVNFDAGAFESYAFDAGAYEAYDPSVATITIGPTQPAGRRTIDDLNVMLLTAGDIVQFESIDESGPFVTTSRLVLRPGVIYRSLDFGHKWGIKGVGGLDLAAASNAIVEDYKGDGANLAGAVGITTTGAAATTGFTMRRYELCNYLGGALKSTHGQWADAVAGVTIGSGPDDSGWLLEDGYHHDNAPAGSGLSDWQHLGKSLVVRRVTWRNTGGGGNAFDPKGRGLRMYDCLFDQCSSPLAPRTGDQLFYRVYFDHCSNPVASVPYDKTGLGGKQGFYDLVMRACTAPGGSLVFFDDANSEAGGLAAAAAYDVVVYDVSILDSTTGAQAFDFRDFTIAGRHVKLRNISHGKNVTAPFRTGYTAGNLDSDYGAYPNGGKPAGETHSITPATTLISESKLLPSAGSAVLGAGTTSGDGSDFTPGRADIGFQGYPSPGGGVAASWLVTPVLAGTGNSAAPGGTFTPGSPLLVNDQIVDALVINQNNLGDLVVTPPAGYILRSSKSVTDRGAVYIATRTVVAGDTLTGAISLPTWSIQDSTGTNQARNSDVFVGVARGVDPVTPVQIGAGATGGNSNSQPAGATAATTITTPAAGALVFGVVMAKPGQTIDTTALDTTNSVPAGTGPGDHWTRHDEQLAGTAAGSASVAGSVYSATLSTPTQAKLAITFSPNSQWAAAILELAPAVSGATDIDPPDEPANLRIEKLTTTSVVVQADPTDYGDATSGGGGGGGGGGDGSAFADVGSPVNWWKLTQDGGLRPSFDSYDPSALFGPLSRAYYDNAGVRSVDRGTKVTNQRYYPRSLGAAMLAIDYSDPAHFKATLDTVVPARFVVGATVQVRDASAKSGAGNAFDKKPNGQYVIQSVAGQIVTFTTGAKTTKGAYNPDSGYIILESDGRQDTIYTVNVTEATIGSASDGVGPLFLPKLPSADPATRGTPANPWVLQPGRTNSLAITGLHTAFEGGGIASLAIEIPPWFDIYNSGADYITNGLDADPQLLNPFCHVEIKNSHLNVVDGLGLKGITGGAASYSEPLGKDVTINGVLYHGLSIPSGEALGWSGCSGVIRGAMNHDFCYDANKFGGGAGNLRWERCTNFRNRWLVRAGGGHTDGYQVFQLYNDLLKSLGGAWTCPNGHGTFDVTPTWYRCYFESGGNAMLFLNDNGVPSGEHIVSDTFTYECIAGTGNKFFLTAGVHNPAARRCLVNGVPTGTDGMDGVRPQPHDYGSNDGTGDCSPDGLHPCPTGNLGWPDPSTSPDLANLRVNADGSTTPIERYIDKTSHPCVEANGCFTFTD